MITRQKMAEIYFEHAIECYDKGEYSIIPGYTDLSNGCHVLSMSMPKDLRTLFMKYSDSGPSVFVLQDGMGHRDMISLHSLPMPFTQEYKPSLVCRLRNWINS